MTLSKTKNQEVLWTKNYILILVNSVLISITPITLSTNLPLYLKNLGSTNMIIGLMTTVFTIFALIFRPIFGFIIDNLGRKIVMLIGVFITAISCFFFAFTQSVEVIFILRAANGIGFCALTTVVGAMIADNVPTSRMAEGIGFSGVPMTIAVAAGPIIGAFLINSFGYRSFFLFIFTVSCINIVFSLLLKYNKVEKPQQKTSGKKKFSVDKTALLPALVLIILAVSFGGIEPFVPTAGVSREIENISMFFTVYAIVALVTRISAGRLADMYGINKVFWAGLIALFFSFVSLAFAHSILTIIISGALYGVGFGITFSLLNAIAMKECSQNKRGLAAAMFFASMDVGIGIGAFLWGGVSQLSGFTLMFLLSGVFVVFGAVLYYILLQKKMSKNNEFVSECCNHN